MSSRVTRSRARSETPQTAVTDFFKTTRKTRGEKKIIEDGPASQVAPIRRTKKAIVTKQENETETVTAPEAIAPIFEKQISRTRARTPTRNAELSTPELTGTPPKKAKEVVLENETEKSALDVLMKANADQKKKKTIRTVADLQARLAAKGAAKAIHAQNLKNKTKQVDEHAEMLKSPKKKILEASPVKSKAARSLFSPKKVPDYVVPGFNVHKSAEKIREEQDDAHEEEGKRMTAEFLKTSRLTEDVKKSVRDRIELPSSYENLADAFKRVDQITAIFLGQNRSCIGSELFKNVRNAAGKEFSETHLAQILHVYPQSYHVKMREQRRTFGQGNRYELEVTPNLVDDLTGYLVEKPAAEPTEELPLVCPSKLLSPVKSPRKAIQVVPRKPQVDCRKRLDAARQRDRAHVFRHKLTSIVMEHHDEFLEKQGLTRMVNMKRMHPLFRLDKHCPPLPQATLPEAPHHKSTIEHIGMKEAVEMCSDSAVHVNLPSFVQKAFDDLKSPGKQTTGTTGTVPVSPRKFSEQQKEQKAKGGMSLLERIRAKEAMQKAAESCVDKELETRHMRLCLLKDRYVRVVCNHYTAKKAQTMEMEVIAKFVQFSSANPATVPDIVEHLRLLAQVAPMYVTEAVYMGKKYLRFTENNLEAIGELLEEEISKTKRQIDAQKSSQIAQMTPLTPRPKAARTLKFH